MDNKVVLEFVVVSRTCNVSVRCTLLLQVNFNSAISSTGYLSEWSSILKFPHQRRKEKELKDGRMERRKERVRERKRERERERERETGNFILVKDPGHGWKVTLKLPVIKGARVMFECVAVKKGTRSTSQSNNPCVYYECVVVERQTTQASECRKHQMSQVEEKGAPVKLTFKWSICVTSCPDCKCIEFLWSCTDVGEWCGWCSHWWQEWRCDVKNLQERNCSSQFNRCMAHGWLFLTPLSISVVLFHFIVKGRNFHPLQREREKPVVTWSLRILSHMSCFASRPPKCDCLCPRIRCNWIEYTEASDSLLANKLPCHLSSLYPCMRVPCPSNGP